MRLFRTGYFACGLNMIYVIQTSNGRDRDATGRRIILDAYVMKSVRKVNYNINKNN